MLWFVVWTVLVVGTVGGGFLLLRSVYRSGKGLLLELERAGSTLERLAASDRELGLTVPEPVELLDPEPARARLEQTRAARLRRRARRADRHAVAHRRWQSFVR